MTSLLKTATWDCGDALGAAVVERSPSHVWMRDPEGNEFCVERGSGDCGDA